MTQTEFLLKLDRLRRLKPFFVGGGVLVFVFNAAVIVYVRHNYPQIPLSRASLLWNGAGFVACWAVIGAWYLVLRSMIRRNAPRCPTCNAQATWREAPAILKTGLCPKCQSAFVVLDSN